MAIALIVSRQPGRPSSRGAAQLADRPCPFSADGSGEPVKHRPHSNFLSHVSPCLRRGSWPGVRHNFRHNLFKPLLLFFYMGFLVPILRVKFEFPYVIYQGLTIYLLIAIGWHGGEELAHADPENSARRSGSWSWASCLNFVHRDPRLPDPLGADADAAGRQGDGGRLLRLGLGRHVRDLPGRAGDGAHRLRRRTCR